MREHTILTYDSEGIVSTILKVQYEGTMLQLVDLINEGRADEYIPVEYVLDNYGINWKCVEFLVDVPYMDISIEM